MWVRRPLRTPLISLPLLMLPRLMLRRSDWRIFMHRNRGIPSITDLESVRFIEMVLLRTWCPRLRSLANLHSVCPFEIQGVRTRSVLCLTHLGVLGEVETWIDGSLQLVSLKNLEAIVFV